jgi:hypothetical protein
LTFPSKWPRTTPIVKRHVIAEARSSVEPANICLLMTCDDARTQVQFVAVSQVECLDTPAHIPGAFEAGLASSGRTTSSVAAAEKTQADR